MGFKERLKELREEKELTQTQVAKAINVTQRNISFYETGTNEPDLKTIAALANFFDVTTDYLLGLSNQRK